MLNCSTGNKPCGGRCIPQHWICKGYEVETFETIEKTPALAKMMFTTAKVAGTVATAPAGLISIMSRDKEDYDKIGSNAADWDKVEIGTVIKKPTVMGGLQLGDHYAVYMGKNKDGHPLVFEVGPTLNHKNEKILTVGTRTAGNLVDRSLDDWSYVDYPEGINRLKEKDIIKNIKRLEEEVKKSKSGIKYDLFQQNCEVIANAVAYGVPYSRQTMFANVFERAFYSNASMFVTKRTSRLKNEDILTKRALDTDLFKWDRGSTMPLEDQVLMAQKAFLKSQGHFKEQGVELTPVKRKKILGRIYSHMFESAVDFGSKKD